MNKIQEKTKIYGLLALTAVLCLLPVLILASTNPVPARVTTYGVRNVGTASANLRGYVSDDGRCADMTVWFEYGTTIDYGQTTRPEEHNGVGYFNEDVFDLTPCTTYHFRGLAKNNTKRLGYGSDRTFKTQCASFDVQTSVRNLTRGDDVWYDALNVSPGDELMYRIIITSTGDVLVQNIMVASDLSDGLIYIGDLKIDGVASRHNINVGSINLGNLFPLQVKVLIFKARVADKSQLNFGINELTHDSTVYSGNYSDVDTSRVYVNRAGVAGAATVAPTLVSTGMGNDILKSVFLPFMVAVILVWVFKSKLIGFEKWAREKREKTIKYRTKRKLDRKIEKSQ